MKKECWGEEKSSEEERREIGVFIRPVRTEKSRILPNTNSAGGDLESPSPNWGPQTKN